jgi:hypothetical protein
MNPPMAEDIQVLEHYLAAEGPESSSSTRPYSLVSNTAGKSIVYLTVPKRRKGLRDSRIPGDAQREILEQVLGSLKSEVIEV